MGSVLISLISSNYPTKGKQKSLQPPSLCVVYTIILISRRVRYSLRPMAFNENRNKTPKSMLEKTSPLQKQSIHLTAVACQDADNTISAQVLAVLRGLCTMCSLTTQNNATDVGNFRGMCSWHAACRNVHRSSSQLSKC